MRQILSPAEDDDDELGLIYQGGLNWAQTFISPFLVYSFCTFQRVPAMAIKMGASIVLLLATIEAALAGFLRLIF